MLKAAWKKLNLDTYYKAGYGTGVGCRYGSVFFGWPYPSICIRICSLVLELRTSYIPLG